MPRPSVVCVVPGCKNNNTNKEISFHYWPKDPSLAEKWLQNIDRPNWTPKERSTVCSSHFTNDCFVHNPDVLKSLQKKVKLILTKSAIPTLFPGDCPIEKREKVQSPTPSCSTHTNVDLSIDVVMPQRKIVHKSGFSSGELIQSFVEPAESTLPSYDKETSLRKHSIKIKNPTIENCKTKNKYIQVYNCGRSIGVQTCRKSRSIGCQTPQDVKVDIGIQTEAEHLSSTMIEQDDDGSDIIDVSETIGPLDTSFTPSTLGLGDTSIIDFSDHLDPVDDVVSEPKYIIFQSALLLLFKYCFTCLAPCTQTLSVIGSLITVRAVCENKHTFIWQSQPKITRKPLGNLLIAGAILFAGLNPSKVLRMFRSIGIVMIGKRAYCKLQKAYLVPSIREAWVRQQDELLTALEGKTIKIGGDGRCDSPGYSALYGSYCFMESTTNKIIHLELVQSSEVSSSQAMELEGLRRGLRYLSVSDVTVGTLVTDRHKSIRRFMREEHPAVKHLFDCWHLAKGVKTKIEAAGKAKKCEILLKWKRSIVNHVYWCAVSSNGNGELARDKWLSVLRHVTNKHSGHDGLFERCAHDDITSPKDWLEESSEAYNKLAYIVKLASRDIIQLSPIVQTSNVEAYHSVVLHFASKSVYYPYIIMEARLTLSVLHFNENSNKLQARKADGTLRYSVSFPKSKQGEYSVKPIREPSTYDYVKNLFGIVLERAELTMADAIDLYERELDPPTIPQPLSAKYVHPDKSDAIETYMQKKRFKST